MIDFKQHEEWDFPAFVGISIAFFVILMGAMFYG
jgi:hypothetical protein